MKRITTGSPQKHYQNEREIKELTSRSNGWGIVRRK